MRSGILVFHRVLESGQQALHPVRFLPIRIQAAERAGCRLADSGVFIHQGEDESLNHRRVSHLAQSIHRVLPNLLVFILETGGHRLNGAGVPQLAKGLDDGGFDFPVQVI